MAAQDGKGTKAARSADRMGDGTCDPVTHAAEQFVLVLDGFEGPLDMLLALAREQKVDLIHISIQHLADQYLEFIQEARKLRLELAADYLVMAAWLAYLKSRLLVPQPEGDEPSGEDMAEALAFQLRRLEAMREAASRLFARPRLGMDILARGAPEPLDIRRKTVMDVSLFDLLKAYGEHKGRKDSSVLHIQPIHLYSLDEAVQRLTELLGRAPDWKTLASFLPANVRGELLSRSSVAAHFAASLELAKAGQVELRQDSAFAPIYMRRNQSRLDED